MKIIAPDYYKKFKCIAGDCKHSCCIGWDVYIDDESYQRYLSSDTPLSGRIINSIYEGDDGYCFKMDKNGRCPFLNSKGLCDIITEGGSDYICEICREHPRFYNFFCDRIEVGLGLCCEEAARLILTDGEDTRLVQIGVDDYEELPITPIEEFILSKREVIFDIIQNRSLTLDKRISSILEECNCSFEFSDIDNWVNFFASLERLDKSWDGMLDQIRSHGTISRLDCFDVEFERLLVYFIYRHASNAQSEEDFGLRVKFAVVAYYMLNALCNSEIALRGCCSTTTFFDFARTFSSEIEYSGENTDRLLEVLSNQ